METPVRNDRVVRWSEYTKHQAKVSRKGTISEYVSFCVGMHGDTPLYMRLGNVGDSNAVIAGVSGSGKTILLNQVIADLVTSYSPKELQLWIADLRTDSLCAWEGMPHIGMMLNQDMHDVLVLDMLRNLAAVADSRYKLLTYHKKSDFAAYRRLAKTNNYDGSRIVLIISESQRIHCSFSEEDCREAEFLLEKIMMLGSKVGVHVILESQNPLKGKHDVWLSNYKFGLRMCLRAAEETSKWILNDPIADTFVETFGNIAVKSSVMDKTIVATGIYLTCNEMNGIRRDIINRNR